MIIEQERVEQFSNYKDIVDWLKHTVMNCDDYAVINILKEAANKIDSFLEAEVSDLLHLSEDKDALNVQLCNYGLSEYSEYED